MIDARVTATTLHPEDEFASFMEAVPTAGAVVSFTGVARPQSRDGASVQGLFLDYHASLSAHSVEEIAAVAMDRFDVTALKAVHRHGLIAPGETIVFVAAASAHRRAAFEAADYMMDRLKTDAVFWKREDTDAGSKWIEPTEADHTERQRWGS